MRGAPKFGGAISACRRLILKEKGVKRKKKYKKNAAEPSSPLRCFRTRTAGGGSPRSLRCLRHFAYPQSYRKSIIRKR